MAIYEGLNYVEGLINNEILSVPPTTNTFNSTLVIGTSGKGKNNTLSKVNFGDMESKYGPGDDIGDFDTSVSHAVFAILASTADTNKDMYVYKVGDAAKSKAVFYEVQVETSGDRSFSFIGDTPVESIVFEGIEESGIANDVIIDVKGDASGLPYSVEIRLPLDINTESKLFYIDPYGTGVGLNNVTELVNAINADTDIAKVLQASFRPLRKENYAVTMTYPATGNPYFDVEPVGANESWGDKLLNIESIKEYMNAYTTLSDTGGSSRLLPYAPDKDADEATATITTFKRLSKEVAVRGIVTNLTNTSISYNLGLNIPTNGFTNTLGDIEVATVIHRTKVGTETIIPYDGSSTQAPATGTYSIHQDNIGDPYMLYIELEAAQALAMDDVVEIEYKYAFYTTEANLRSDIVLGNKNSYFVSGTEIVFGADPGEIELIYNAIKTFAPSDYNILDRNEIKIEFINSNKPVTPSQNVIISFTYLPELPAPSNTVIMDGAATPAPYTIQVSGMSNGTAGNLISKKRYKELVEIAFEDLMLTPFRRIIVAGAFLNDTVEDIDYNTGLPGKFDLGWGAMLAQKLDMKSRVSGECTTILGVKPISAEYISQGIIGYNKWVEELTADVTNQLSPAAIINGLDSMYMDAALGAIMVQNGNILNSRLYLENPAYVLCGMQLDSSLEQSIIAQTVPPFVQSLLYGFPSGQTVAKLNNMRYTTFSLNMDNQIVISDAPTLDAPGKQFNRQLVRDTVFTATRLARTVARDFIGKRRNTQMLGIMQSKVNKIVNGAMTPKYLSTFNCEIVPVAGGHISGATKLRMFMGTSVEIRNVYLETSVKLEGEDI